MSLVVFNRVSKSIFPDKKLQKFSQLVRYWDKIVGLSLSGGWQFMESMTGECSEHGSRKLSV